MSTTPLDTNFKDDILASSNAKRKYQMTYNDDGTVSFQDVTAYSQMGSAFGAKEVNEERAAINKINSDRIVTLDEIDLVTEPGFFVDAMAVKELNRKLPACNEIYTGVANHAQYDIPDITPYDLLVIYGGPGTYANTSMVVPVASIVYKDDGQFALGVYQGSSTFWELEFNFPTSTKINIANYKNQSWTTPAIRKILGIKL